MAKLERASLGIASTRAAALDNNKHLEEHRRARPTPSVEDTTVL